MPAGPAPDRVLRPAAGPGSRRLPSVARSVSLLPLFLPVFPFFSLFLLLGSPDPARGQVTGPAVLATGALGPVVLEGEFGLEAAAGVEVRWSGLAAELRGAELALVPGEAEPGYRWETLSGGQRRCRDLSSGRFAADTRCIELDTAFGASAEASWRIAGGRRPLRVGAGLRVGDGTGPYATVRWRAVPLGARSAWRLRASAGPSLLRLGAGVGLSL